MEQFDELVLWHIASFLGPEDIVRLRRTCRRMYIMLPEVVLTNDLWKGDDFYIYGGRAGEKYSAEWYFDGPILPGKVIELNMLAVWVDQGWGNKKGRLSVILMRPSRTGEPLEIAEDRSLFGIAEHYPKEAHKVIGRDDPVVAKSKKGDFYRFMRFVGGGGGHALEVKNFRVKATMCKVKY